MQVLDSLGIKSILNLRADKSDAEIPGAEKFNLYSVKMHPYNLNSSEIKRALQIIDTAPKPLLVHCKHGADRTGVVIAFYRILIQYWSREEAIIEMKKGGYGFHKKYFNIPVFIKKTRF